LVGATLLTLLAACSDGEAAPSTTTVPIDTSAIAADMPAIDGSTSTEPLRRFLYCGLMGLECEWVDGFFPFHATVWPVGAESNDTYWDVEAEAVRSTDPEVDGFLTHVITSGTHGSYETLIAGDSDLIIVARAPSEVESADASAAGVGFEIQPVALDAFVFLVNAGNPLDTLSLNQIRGIYDGSITEWTAVGGPSTTIERIHPYRRNDTSGSEELMATLVMPGLEMPDPPELLLLDSMSLPFDALATDESGIAYSVYFYSEYMQPTEMVKMIGVDGVAPSAGSIRDGSYPLVTEVFAVIREGDGGTIRLLFDWLPTADGQEAIAATGYVPLP
jgi:phosphate transport system substrate-binding protein